MKASGTNNIIVRIASCLAAAVVICAAPAGGAQQGRENSSPPSGLAQRVLQRPAGGSDAPVVVNADLISLNVAVADTSGRLLSGLNKSAFTILDDGRPQEIAFFSDADDPVSVGIIFDVSGSMSGEKIETAREALTRFIQTSHTQDEYSLIAFNSRADVLLERTRDADAVLRKLTYIKPHGDTALYDAVYLGVEKLRRGTHPKRVLLLITDGDENDSRYTFREVRDSLAESGTIVYSVCILDPIRLTGKAGMRVQDILNGLSGATGGKAFYPRSESEMVDDFERIALELRHLYSIGYRPKDFTADGRWHSVKVKVAPPAGYPRVSVRSRRGYNAVPGLR